MSEEARSLAEATQRPLSFTQTMQAVFWSFFGVRRSRDMGADVSRLNPIHLLVGGLIGAALFVCTLVLLVQWVISSGIAA